MAALLSLKMRCFLVTVDSRNLVPIGNQNLRVRVKWFSRYLPLLCEGPNARLVGSQSHTHLLNPNSMLRDNGCTYISRISADIDIAPATNHNKPYYILITMQQKLSNYTLHKVAYDGFCNETIQTTMQFDRKRKWRHHCSRVSPKLYAVTEIKGLSCHLYGWVEKFAHFNTWVTGFVMWAATSDQSLKFGVQGASATNQFQWVNSARDNGIWLYNLI